MDTDIGRPRPHYEEMVGFATPQILFCLGWPQADRSPLPPTARRPVTQVMIRAD